MSNVTQSLYKPVGTDWFPGWHLIGQYESDVGSWLLHHEGKAMLLEIPEGLTPRDVRESTERLRVKLRYITTSHDHMDHLDIEALKRIRLEHLSAYTIPPDGFYLPNRSREFTHYLGMEPMWFIPAPKHSERDTVIIFRGVAMTGDIELNTLDSVNDEVSLERRRESMSYLGGFEKRNNYHVHSIVSAHLNDVRTNINFSDLFRV